jgi:hypothetical protein
VPSFSLLIPCPLSVITNSKKKDKFRIVEL